MGHDGGRRKTYSGAVIDGIKRNSRIYVGHSTVRKTDARLTVRLPGVRIEHVTERTQKLRIHTGPHRDEQCRQGSNNNDSGEIQEPIEEDVASRSWTDHLIRNCTCG